MARPLTDREKQVAKLVACGLSNSAIGKRLGTSRFTVMRQVETIADKMGIGMVDGKWGLKRLRLAVALNTADLTEEIQELRAQLATQ